jgi:hypothetical protein
MHGDPRTTDVCYTNDPDAIGDVQLADHTGLANFVKLVILPRNNATIRIALVMCYGARCKRYQRAQVDHMGMIAANDLKTSLSAIQRIRADAPRQAHGRDPKSKVRGGEFECMANKRRK